MLYSSSHFLRGWQLTLSKLLVRPIKLTTQSTFPQAADLFGVLVDVWSDRLDSVNNVKYRKLTGLAIANLLPIADP